MIFNPSQRRWEIRADDGTVLFWVADEVSPQDRRLAAYYFWRRVLRRWFPELRNADEYAMGAVGGPSAPPEGP